MSTGRNGDVSKGGGVGVDPEATSATPLASVIDVPDGHELTTAGQMIFLGDSDVSRWPSSLYPIIPSGPRVVNYGISGARLVDLLQQTAHWKAQNEDPRDGNCLFICCAGENDIGSGIPMERIFEAFRTILDAIFPTINPDQRHDSRMIFFGPKFEPWLTDDHASRKKYARLNNGLQRTIRKHHAFDRVKSFTRGMESAAAPVILASCFFLVPAASLAHTESLLLPHPGNVGPSPPLRYNIIAASELISRA